MGILEKEAIIEDDYSKESNIVFHTGDTYQFLKSVPDNNLGVIDTGIEIVPIKQLANEMSTGVSYFEQFVWDLENHKVADIDIPVLIIGIDA